MNKSKGAGVQKTLVRNPQKPLPQTVVTSKASTSSKIDAVSSCSSRIKEKEVPSTGAIRRTRFDVPEMHSTLKFSKRVDELVDPKTIPKVALAKLAIDEKVTRKVNFPQGQTVFKDLIPLSDSKASSQPSVARKGPVYQKDKEPVLADFLKERKQKVYYYDPKIDKKWIKERKMDIPASDAFKLYNILQMNGEFS